MPFELIIERGAGADQIYLEVAAGRHHVHPRRPLLRGAGQAPVRRGAAGAARARREGCRRARRRRRRAARPDRPARRSATGSSSGPGEKIATDGIVEEGSSAVDAVAADRRVGARRESARATTSPGRRSTPAAACRAGDAGRRGHRARADRPARDRGADRQGAGPAARRPHLGGVRADRHRPRRGHPRLLAGGRRERRRSPSPPRWPC